MNEKMKLGYFPGYKNEYMMIVFSGNLNHIKKLQSLFMDLANGLSDEVRIDKLDFIEAYSNIKIIAKVVTGESFIIFNSQDGIFYWGAKKSDWDDYAWWISCFEQHSDNQSGHQYLETEKYDNILIMISKGEYSDEWWEEHSMENIWNVCATFGPLGATWSNYHVVFAKEGVLMIPAGIFSSLSASPAFAGTITGMLSGLEKDNVGNSRVLTDEGSPKWKRYYIDDIERILLKHSFFANEIRIKVKGQKEDVYGILVRHQTDEIRKAAKELYADIYEEKGFKKSV